MSQIVSTCNITKGPIDHAVVVWWHAPPRMIEQLKRLGFIFRDFQLINQLAHEKCHSGDEKRIKIAIKESKQLLEEKRKSVAAK